jgi:hypothetical protein
VRHTYSGGLELITLLPAYVWRYSSDDRSDTLQALWLTPPLAITATLENWGGRTLRLDNLHVILASVRVPGGARTGGARTAHGSFKRLCIERKAASSEEQANSDKRSLD